MRATSMRLHDAPQPRRVGWTVEHEQPGTARDVDGQTEKGGVDVVLVDASLVEPEDGLSPTLLFKRGRPATQRSVLCCAYVSDGSCALDEARPDAPSLWLAVVGPRMAYERVDAAKLDGYRGSAQLGAAERGGEVARLERRPR